MIHVLGRRHLLAAAMGIARLANADSPARETATGEDHFDVDDVRFDGAGDTPKRAWFVAPKDRAERESARVLVLWHGLGETTDVRAGVGAWVERYGLLTSFERLTRPPVAARTQRGDLADERAREISRTLEEHPFGGRFIFVCPYTPNLWKQPSPAQTLDRLADWIPRVLLPRVSDRAKVRIDASRTGIDGCSLGGLVSLEVVARRPEIFRSCGGVQAALSQAQVPALAARLARALGAGFSHRIHLETSRQDPFYAANLQLSRELQKAGIARDLSVSPGPHDQPWLREVGTLEMLLWHDRALGEVTP